VRLEKLDSEFLHYLVEHHVDPGDKLPSLNEIGGTLGVSVGKLREELAAVIRRKALDHARNLRGPRGVAFTAFHE